MQFTELAVVNYGNVAKAKIDLDYTGITFILGKNKDAGPGATNGAGKSQFWSALPEIAYGTPPSGKDSHKHKNSKIRLTLKQGENVLGFTKAYNKSGSKAFSVTKNGKDVNVRTLDYAQKKLQSVLGKTEEDFYTRVYVDSLQAHPLISGTAAQRQEFFVRMFNLENVDALRKLLLAELSGVQKIAATYREVKALFDEAKEQLSTTEEEREQLAVDIKQLRKKRDALLTVTEELQHVRDLLAFERDNEKLLRNFNKLTSTKGFSEDYAEAKAKVQRLKKMRSRALDWVSYNREFKLYKKDKAEVESQLSKLFGDNIPSAKDIKAKAELWEENKHAERVLASKLDDLGKVEKPEKVAKPEYEVDKCTAQLAKLKEELEHSHEFKSGKCPTCGSSVKARDTEDVDADIAKWAKRKAKAVAYDQYVKDYEDYLEAKAKRGVLEKKLEDATARVVKFDKYPKAKKLLGLVPETPEKPEGNPVDVADVDEGLDKATRRVAFFDSVEPLIERIEALAKVTKDQRRRAEEYTDVSTKLAKLNTELTQKETFKVQQDEAVTQLDKLRGRGKTLKRQAQEEELLKELVSAYSTKGIKKLLIQRSASLLERQVNKFVRFVFSEDFTFQFKYDTRLEVLVHRKYGKQVKTSDVKRLSGAEKKMFTLLLVIAAYTITPASRRSNLLILDELEANMGPEAVKNFLKTLPVLNKIIPHIVVITPRPELHVEGARYFTAVKHKGVTQLLEGRQ